MDNVNVYYDVSSKTVYYDVSSKTPVEIIRDARAALIEHGRTTGNLRDDKGLCLLGALAHAAGVPLDCVNAYGYLCIGKQGTPLNQAAKFTALAICASPLDGERTSKYRATLIERERWEELCWGFNDIRDPLSYGRPDGDGEVLDVLDAAELLAKEAQA